MHTYNNDFYAGHARDCQRSARRIIPIILKMFSPQNVLDVGCGDGIWLAEFKSHGLAIAGVDGPYVKADMLRIPSTDFTAHNLEAPLDLKRQFDLVTTLEVAEHLAESAADTFVASLVRHGQLVIFSASIPGQFGENHLNEQWPRYWVEKFRKHGYKHFDVIRRRIWNDDEISWWYRQNILVFATPERAAKHEILSLSDSLSNDFPLNVAHPEFMNLFRSTLRDDSTFRGLWHKLLVLLKSKIRR